MNEGTAASRENSEMAPQYARPGFINVAPYMLVKRGAEFLEFLLAAFGATERIRVPNPDGSIMHAEVGLGNSVMELGDENAAHPARQVAVHLYVDDADATYERALQAGATALHAVGDMPWGDRQGAVKDKFGNRWYIGMPKGWKPGPEGIRNVQPFLHLRDALKFVPFVVAAFGAEAQGVALSDAGEVLHATIRIGSGTVEISEATEESPLSPGYMHFYVPDTDAAYANALKAGATSIEAPNDKPYGERMAGIRDAFGNVWWAATYLG